jgi:hypothetical protein
MKVLLFVALFLSASTSFAQTINLASLKTLMTQKKSVLENVYPGMSKKMITSLKYETELGDCVVTESAVQTVLRLEGEKIIVYSKETYTPDVSPACAGFEPQTVGVLFYEDKPSLSQEFADLDETASAIKSISRSGDIVTMLLSAEGDSVTVKYDFSKSFFKNTLLIQDKNSTMTGSDIADIDVNTIDLKNVLFCASADSDDCSLGDWSDVLF